MKPSICCLLSVPLWLAAMPACAEWPPAPPPRIELAVVDGSVAAAGRVGAIARGGVPLPQSLAVTAVERLRLLDPSGAAVPAQFRVLARWNAPIAQLDAPIQWLLAEAPAPPAGARLRLQFDAVPGASPAPPTPLTVTLAGGRYTIATGAARFVVDPASGSLLAELRAADGSLRATGLPTTFGVDGGGPYSVGAVRLARIDAQGPLSATLTVEWETNAPSVGGGGVSLRRQYRFEAGSASAVVRSALAWEGSRCPSVEQLACAAGVNGLRLDWVRERWQPAFAGTRSVHVLAEAGAAPEVATLAPGAAASLRQLRRDRRSDPPRYQISLAGVTGEGTRAGGGVLALSAAGSGAIGLALAGMDRHEPQALRVLPDGVLALDWVDAPGVWLGNHQAVHASAAIALPAAPVDAQALERELRAPLAHPLRLWASPAVYAASGAVPEFPVGSLPAPYADYDGVLQRMLTSTQERVASLGLEGLMTSGLWPSDWGTPLDAPPDCAGNDPTPADDWDDSYWCASWTDYHNAATIAVLAALRAGAPAWFDALAEPAALRMLHTQILQCAPDDPWFYCFQAPAGGGGYRANFNSSHAYVENLILYHFLTGDPWTIDTLARGARSMRGYLCPARGSTPPGPMCAPTEPGGDDFLQLNDRAASQWYEVFRALGQSVDGSYLEDWRGNIARWMSLFWAQGSDAQGRRLGFMVQSGVGNGLSILAPGAYTTSQLWMTSGYDFEQLARLSQATLDAPLGSPALAPSTVIADWGRTLAHTASLPPGNGSAAGIWPNALDFVWSGSRIGGQISGVAPFWLPAPMPQPCFDACLYDTGKAFMSATLARAAALSADPAVRLLAEDLTRHAIGRALQADVPLGKPGGLYLVRLSSAVARLQAMSVPDALFAGGFE